MKNRVRTSERGVAVLFSLGILGMMTVLALTFASISMTNQTIAKNATKQSSAKEMARGIVERVQYVLNHSGYSGGIITKPTQLQKFFSKENGTSHFDWIWKLGGSYYTGRTPAYGAVMQSTSGRYGHVAVVVAVVQNQYIKIQEMNYAGFNRVFESTITWEDAIKYNYIYAHK